MRSAIIYFGNVLSRQQVRDSATRRRALEEGIELIQAIPDVEISSYLPNACAIVVRLSEVAIDNVRAVLEDSRKGHIRVHDPARPAFKAAR